MEPKIVKKESMTVIGIPLETSVLDGKNFKEIPELWERVLKENLHEQIPNKVNEEVLLGICMDFDGSDKFTYMIASPVTTTDKIPEGMVVREIAANTYAQFTARGEMPKSIQDTFKYIYGEWLPGSDYKRGCGLDIEWYDERCTDCADSEVDILVAVVKK